VSSEANKDFVRRYLAALSGKPKPPELVSKYVDDRDLQQHIATFEAAFPRYELIVEDMVAEGDKVVVRATFKGTQRADFHGIPATGREAIADLMLIYQVVNGRVVAHWMNADRLSLLQQLGAIPEPETVSA
jgi:predicted ester cyclase